MRKTWFLIIAVICIFAVAACAEVPDAPDMPDVPDTPSAPEIPDVPDEPKEIILTDVDARKMQTAFAAELDGVEFVTVHRAKKDGHHFLLGASIIKYGDVWICAYGQSMVEENDATSRFACRYSYDGGKTWGEEITIAGVEGEFCHSHGILFEYEGKLWAFCPRAKYRGGTSYAGLTMEAYTLQSDMTWKHEGRANEGNFWPLGEPIKLSNGTYLIEGLDCTDALQNKAKAAVAISDGDMLKWEMVTIDHESAAYRNEKSYVWGETTVVEYHDRLVAYVRSDIGRVVVSESFDCGKTWSKLTASNFAIDNSKVYGGTLSTGSKYLIYNLGSRNNLRIAIGDTDGSYGFNTVYMIRDGFVTPAQFLGMPQWAYPYAVEEDGYLYVVYSEHKESCELAIIPVASLSVIEDKNVYHEEAYYGKDADIPAYKEICELVDTKSWWTGDGNDGKQNLTYGEIDGTPVVIRQQAANATVSGNQTLRRHFDVDLSGAEKEKLGFVITFYSSKSLPPNLSATHRLFWGESIPTKAAAGCFPSNYKIDYRLDYKATKSNCWGGIKAGWNTWTITYNMLGSIEDVDDINSFFIIFEDNASIENGQPIFALSSVKIVEFEE